jgi:hypothetical protein
MSVRDSDYNEAIHAAVPIFGALAGYALGGQMGASVGAFLGVWATTLIPYPEEPLEETSYSLTGISNKARPWEPVPCAYGELRMFPPLAANTYVDFEGEDQYLNALFCFGYGPLELDDLKIGESPLKDFLGVSIDFRNTFGITPVESSLSQWRRRTIPAGSDKSDLFADYWDADTNQKIPNTRILYAPSWNAHERAVRPGRDPNVYRFVTAPDTSKISVTLLFPEGLYKRIGENDGGERVDFAIRFRPYAGELGRTAAWQYVVPDWALIDAASRDTFADQKWYIWLERANERLAELIALLSGVTLVERIVARVVFRAVLALVAPAQASVAMRLGALAVGATGRDILVETNTLLGALNTLCGTLDASQEVLTNLWSANALLTGILRTLSTIADIVAFEAYVDRGYGPPVTELTFAQRLYGYALAELVGRETLAVFAGVTPGGFMITAQSKDPLYRTIVWDTRAPCQFEVEIRRCTPDTVEAEDSSDEHHTASNVYATTEFRSWQPVSDKAYEQLTLVALRVKNSEKLSGNLDSFNAIVRRPVAWHNGTSWQAAALTDADGYPVFRNNAWIACDILRGLPSPDPAPDARVDLTRFAAWARTCARKYTPAEIALGYPPNPDRRCYFDGVFDSSGTTVLQALRDVCRTGKATPTVRGGQYSVVEDKMQYTAAAVITDRNCANVQVAKPCDDIPHAYRLAFVNVPAGYQQDQMLVCDDDHGDVGSGLPYPDIIEELSFRGLRDALDKTATGYSGLTYRLGRYLLKCATLRPETVTLEQDWEQLAVERGDRVDLQLEALMVGIAAGRITALTTGGGLITGIILDELVTMISGSTYYADIRQTYGDVVTAELVTVEGSGYDLTFAAGIDPEIYQVVVGCLVKVRDTDAVPFIVRAIEYKDDLTAQLTCVEMAAAVHDDEWEPIPDFDPHISYPTDPETGRPPMPAILGVVTDERALLQLPGGALQVRILVDIEIPTGRTTLERWAARHIVGIEARIRQRMLPSVIPFQADWTFPPFLQDLFSHLPTFSQQRQEFVGPWVSLPVFRGDQRRLAISSVEESLMYDIEVRTTTEYGAASEWRYYPDIYVVGKLKRPPDVRTLILIGGRLTWEYLPPIDHAGFRVRSVLGNQGSWDTALPCHAGLLSASEFDVTVLPHGIRTLFVKAFDTGGRESVRAAMLYCNLTDAILRTERGRQCGYETEDHGFGTGWVFDIDTMETDGDELVAIAESQIWVTEDDNSFWGDTDLDALFWGDGDPDALFWVPDYCACGYTIYPINDLVDGCALLTVSNTLVGLEITASGGNWRAEFRNCNARLWPHVQNSTSQDDCGDTNIWPSSLAEDFWPAEMDWRPMGADVIGNSDVRGWPRFEYDGIIALIPSWQFRVRAPASNERLRLAKFDIVNYAPAVVEHIGSFLVAASGTVNLPVSGPFSWFDSCILHVEPNASYPNAQTAEVIDLNPSHDPWEQATGPEVVVKDNAGNRTAGMVQATLVGYDNGLIDTNWGGGAK